MFTVKFTGHTGRFSMAFDATPLHEYLKTCGAEVGPDGLFRDRPRCSALIDSNAHKIGTDLLLKTGPVSVALADHYSRPITPEVLRRLGESVVEKINAIVDHYRPIEIVVKIVEKGKRPPEDSPDATMITG